MTRAGISLLLILIFAFSTVTLPHPVNAASPVHVSVLGAPISVGSSFQISFYIDVSYCTTCGTATAYVRSSSSSTHLWESSAMTVSGGLDYEVVAPGISTPGSYFAGVMVIGPSNGGLPGAAVLGETSFSVVGSAAGSTDWAIISVSLVPPAPNVGDPVLFSMVFTALSSPGPFPQSVSVGCAIDSKGCGTGTVTYPGPTGTPYTVTTQTPWMATPGPHKLVWAVATIPVGLDPNKSNNVMSITFTVAQVSPQQTTTASSTASQAPDFQVNVTPPSQTVLQGQTVSYSVNVVALNGFNSQVSLVVSGLPSGASGVFSVPAANPDFVSTLLVTLPTSVLTGSYTLTVTGTGGGITHVANVLLAVNQSTQTLSTTETTTPVGSSITDIIQQNPLIVLVAIVLILLAVLALRRRPSGPTPVPQPPANVVYCSKCGNQNPTTNQYCSKCGAKLG